MVGTFTRFADFLQTFANVWSSIFSCLIGANGKSHAWKTGKYSSLKDLGCITPEALKFIANFWGNIAMTSDFHWSTLEELNLKMLEELEDRGLLTKSSSNSYEAVVRGWLYPLHQLEIGKSEVNIEELKNIQRNWTP
jgi:hypothetical protein